MKLFLLILVFIVAIISDLIFSVGRYPVALLILSALVVLYTYASPYILKR